MSDSGWLVVITSLGVATAFYVYYVSDRINRLGDQILIGFIGEHPVSLKQRWLMLYSRWVTYVTGAVSGFLFLAGAALLIAKQVDDSSIRLLGYFAAFFELVISVMWFFQGGVLFVNYRSILREAEAD
jgi:nitrate reductase gamma subunit